MGLGAIYEKCAIGS